MSNLEHKEVSNLEAVTGSLKNPVCQSMFTIKGLKGLVDSEILGAELYSKHGKQDLNIVYRLHEDFDLKALFDEDRRVEFLSKTVEYVLFTRQDLSAKTTLTLQGLELRSVTFANSALSNAPVLLNLNYYVDAIV
jgi:hypothetical protein